MNFKEELFSQLISPIKSIKLSYMPLLMVYFAGGFSCFYLLAETFWIKNSLSISVEEIVTISIWANMPWSMKVIFGQIIDSTTVFKDHRRAYIVIGSIIMTLGIFLIIAVANDFRPVCKMTSSVNLLIIASSLLQVGIVIQDLIADTLCYEIVPKEVNGQIRIDQEINDEVGIIQQLARIFDIGAAILGVSISGMVASYDYGSASWALLLIPAISVSGALAIKNKLPHKNDGSNPIIFFAGISYVAIIMIVLTCKLSYGLEIIFICASLIIVLSICYMIKDLPKREKIHLWTILLMFFAFRSTPTYNAGIEWWQIDELGFTPRFKAHLDQINLILGMLGIWFFTKKALKLDIGNLLIGLSTIHVLLQLPMIAISFGLHDWTMKHFDFGAQTIAIIDSSIEGPFQRLGFLSLCYALTYYAPKKYLISWFALSMSLMSIAPTYAGRLIKKYLAIIYPIERGNYEYISNSLIATSMLNISMPIITILLIKVYLKLINHEVIKR